MTEKLINQYVDTHVDLLVLKGRLLQICILQIHIYFKLLSRKTSRPI